MRRYVATPVYAGNTRTVQETQAALAKERQLAVKALVNIQAQAKGQGAALSPSAAGHQPSQEGIASEFLLQAIIWSLSSAAVSMLLQSMLVDLPSTSTALLKSQVIQ